MLVVAGFAEASESPGQTQSSRYQLFRSLESTRRFFSLQCACSEWPHFKKAQDEQRMNLNFAFACMIVVSFAIALGHA
ncbi:hypothetical protein F7R05_14815 [Pseudomonas koreensis]|nr:hypothetical protein F7R05_14815 [Pseudomonas koreensis]